MFQLWDTVIVLFYTNNVMQYPMPFPAGVFLIFIIDLFIIHINLVYVNDCSVTFYDQFIDYYVDFDSCYPCAPIYQ